ncbi:hypothetical protein MKW94_005404, partial [Papaver nudicaule]|nr:hypothetical protein [Papaver nudicaule]MCL7032771.1 hypothetical protein [Papaver nudicaule]
MNTSMEYDGTDDLNRWRNQLPPKLVHDLSPIIPQPHYDISSQTTSVVGIFPAYTSTRFAGPKNKTIPDDIIP